MKTERNILIAFGLNLIFAVFEFCGGIFTGSIAILSDSLHDFGDAISIGISYCFEKLSRKPADEVYTYGYERYSVLGGFVTSSILLAGSLMVIISSATRLFHPTDINRNGMIFFAIAGTAINLCAVFFTKDGHSLNQKAVNLHMLEDALGWIAVLIGGIIIKFTDFVFIDPLLSISVAVFIAFNAIKNIKKTSILFLERIPDGINIFSIEHTVLSISGVLNVHHIHLWSLNGETAYATMHIVISGNAEQIKDEIRHKLKEQGIVHLTLEVEDESEYCSQEHCHIEPILLHLHHH